MRNLTRLFFMGLLVAFLGLGGYYACGGDPLPGLDGSFTDSTNTF